MDTTVVTAFDLDINGSAGSEVLNGGAGNDRIFGGAGEDTMNGGAGSDLLNSGSGNDTLIYNLVANSAAGTTDSYMGGSGKDALVLQFTRAEWLLYQLQIANHLAHLAAVTNAKTGEVSNGVASDFQYTFGSSRLTVQMIESLRVFVDGVELTAANDLVTANADTGTTTEEGPGTNVYVLANDVVPDLVRSIAVATGPAHGAAVAVTTDPNPANWYVRYEPSASYYQYLAVGESTTDSFTYTVTDANMDSATTTVTITITGTNDVVSITSVAQAGAVVEDAAATADPSDSTSANGTVSFTDLDLSDSHTASSAAAPGNTTALGTFALAAVSEAAGAASGSVGWTYTLDNAAAQYLAAGASVSETHVVTVDDGHGSTATQDVVITITGTNDIVSITSAAQAGTVVEDAATTPDATDSSTASGIVTFTDVDLADTHTALSAAAASNTTTLGIFALAAVSEAADAASGSVGWTYTLDNAAVQAMAAGASASETYVVTVDDGHGSTATQDVVITITGTNDLVSITSGAQAGTVVEDAATTPDATDSSTATGTISFSDVDLADTHTAPSAAAVTNTTALGLFALTEVSEAADAASGSVDWTYTLDNAAAQYLAAGASASETYVVTVDDGHGSTATQNVVIAITGTNDVVSITSAAQSGAVVEDAAATPDPTDSSTATGSVTFTDADLADSHSATFAAAPGNTTALGLFALATVSEAPESASGSVDWSYTLNNAAAQSLAAGASVSETYVVTVDDGNGSTATQNVVITITGSNDAPDIQVVTTDTAAATLTETNSGLTAAGTLSVSDPDTADAVASSVTGVVLTGTSGTLTPASVLSFLSVSPNTGLPANTGNVHNLAWNFNSGTQAFNYLAAGEFLTMTYTVESSDGNGGTDTQQVAITINGTADGPSNISLAGIAPGGNNVPNGMIGQFSASDATGPVTFNATVVEKNLLGTTLIDATPDVNVSPTGALNATNGLETGRIYELNVTATDAGGSLTEAFRVVIGSTGNDNITLASTVEDLAILGGENDTVFAGAGDDTVFGQNGNDLIHGGEGNDVLNGMGGADKFFFDTTLNGLTNVDRLIDFNAGNTSANGDTLSLSITQFGALGAGALTTQEFALINTGGSGDLTGLSVAGSAAIIVYDTSANGGLYYDVDGGTLANAVRFATLVGVSGTLDFTDFIVE